MCVAYELNECEIYPYGEKKIGNKIVRTKIIRLPLHPYSFKQVKYRKRNSSLEKKNQIRKIANELANYCEYCIVCGVWVCVLNAVCGGLVVCRMWYDVYT